MILEGKSNEEIEQFMFERYGDFIFYRPRFRAETVLLWFGPLIFLLIGGFVAHGIYRKAAVADNGGADSLSDEQEAQISELVGNTGKAE
jgi:cytochrome c-type biogenesis protein CcmH